MIFFLPLSIPIKIQEHPPPRLFLLSSPTPSLKRLDSFSLLKNGVFLLVVTLTPFLPTPK